MRCEIHNKTMLSLGGSPVCSACLANGSAAAKRLMDGMRARTADLDLRRRVEAAAIPNEFVDATFANFVRQTAQAESIAKVLGNYCQNFAAQRTRRSGFVFTGFPGTGKTHLACAMVNDLLVSGFTAVYSSLPRLTRSMRATFGRSGAHDALIRSLVDADFLVLDEIDLHGTSDTDYNTLYDIIDSRYAQGGHPTLVMSNRQLDHLKSDLDERVVSRLLGGSKPVVFDWASRRELPPHQRRDAAVKAVR